jgi:triacylglycerol lipase
MLARLQRGWILGQMALCIAVAWWASQSSLWWLAIFGALAVLNLHALALACEFTWLGRIDPGPGVPRPTALDLCGAWWGEVVTGLRVFAWRQPFRSSALQDELEGTHGKRGVLLLHGFVCNRGLWNPWMNRLHQAGIPYLAINLEPVFGSIDRYVGAIEAAVRRMEAATSKAPVVVAHSMGGLAIRAWLRQPAAQRRLHSVVTIGTPHAGTWLARFAMTENARQMREGSRWLRDLRAAELRTTPGMFTCYFGNCDNIVFPAKNATLNGATNRHVPGVAHVHLAFHSAILEDVLNRTRS